MANSALVREVKVNIPDIATKQIAMRVVNEKEIITLSSNWLIPFGFDETTRVVERSLGTGKGIAVRVATESELEQGLKTKKVYTRLYTSRSSNILNPPAKRSERQIEIASQVLIKDAMGQCERIHVTFSHGVITFRPINKEHYELIQQLTYNEQINTLVAMTGGVDAYILESQGFNISAIVEYRPNAKRDKSDLTETTALCAAVNSSPNAIFNEDIYHLDVARMSRTLKGTPISVGHFSLSCKDFSPLKTNKLKQASLNDLSSTIDMFMPVLEIVSALNIPVVVIENVPSMMSNPINNVLSLQLARRGFTVKQQIMDAREYGGLTSRKRLYMVASALPCEFQFPVPVPYTRNVWNEVIIPNLPSILKMDVTDTKVMKDALAVGRARLITKDKPFCPTIVAAQSQDTKDAVVVEYNRRYYRLPLKVQKALNCIDESFNLDWMAQDKGSQIIGNSVCANLHHKVMDAVKSHIFEVAKIRPKEVAITL